MDKNDRTALLTISSVIVLFLAWAGYQLGYIGLNVTTIIAMVAVVVGFIGFGSMMVHRNDTYYEELRAQSAKDNAEREDR